MDESAKYNRHAWDKQVSRGNRWTVPVTSEQIADARQGNWSVVLTPQKPVPDGWFRDLKGLDVLCLASGGGQQAPLMAAAGANVTSLDNSPAQLGQDQLVAEREGLNIRCVVGDMREFPAEIADQSFDLVFNPVSVTFIPDVLPVFAEVHRVLRPGGRFLAGFTNPAWYIFDMDKMEAGSLVVRHRLPYSDKTHLTESEWAALEAEDEPLMFSHSLEEILAGQLKAGLRLVDLFEDRSEDEINKYLPVYLATLSERPS